MGIWMMGVPFVDHKVAKLMFFYSWVFLLAQNQSTNSFQSRRVTRSNWSAYTRRAEVFHR
jgi:hypothetical protein